MIDAETFYLIHSDDDYPPTFIHFDPDGEIEKVLVSSYRYNLMDEEEGYGVESSNDEDAIYKLKDKYMVDNGLATLDDDGDLVLGDDYADPRFYVQDCMDMDSPPDWFDGFGSHYVSTDGWRGYTDVDYDRGQWQAYASGWLTGYPDGSTSYKMTAADLHNKLWEGELTVPFPIVWFFGVTSNVFSQTSDILIPADREDDFTEWLTTVAGFDGEAVQHAFN